MKIRALLLAGLFASVALAASSFEESSGELAKDIAPALNGKTVAVLDFLDQQKNVRELGRVLADQYLRVDLSKLGVKTVTRSALDRALNEIKLSQAGLTDAINDGLGNKFKAADVIVTGSLSQIGDSYTASIEAIDVKSGSSLGSSRSTFPKIASVQKLWDTVIEASRTTNPPPGAQGSSNTLTLPAQPVLESRRDEINFDPWTYGNLAAYGCFGSETSDDVNCIVTLTMTNDREVDLAEYVKSKSFFLVDSFGRRYDAVNANWIVPGSEPKSKLTLYQKIAMRLDIRFTIPKAVQSLAIVQMFNVRWPGIEITGR
jgi:hypothetical protein